MESSRLSRCCPCQTVNQLLSRLLLGPSNMKTPHAPSSRRGGNLGTFISRLNGFFFFSVDGISLAGFSIHELEFLSARFNFKFKV